MDAAPSESKSDEAKFRSLMIPLLAPKLLGREQECLLDVLRSNWLTTQGQYVDRLEEAFEGYTGCPSLAVANGTGAIQLGLRLLGVGPGDEVMVSTLRNQQYTVGSRIAFKQRVGGRVRVS